MLSQTLSILLAVTASLTNALPNPNTAPEFADTVAFPDVAQRSSFSGEGTVYTQDGVVGSCGHSKPDSAKVVALGNDWMHGESPAPLCGRKIRATNKGSDDGVGGAGRSVTVTVADTCEACDKTHLDFSVGAWNALTRNAPFGTIEIEWSFI